MSCLFKFQIFSGIRPLNVLQLQKRLKYFILKNLFRCFTYVNIDVGLPGKVRSVRVSSYLRLVNPLKGEYFGICLFLFSKKHVKTTCRRPCWESNPALPKLVWTLYGSCNISPLDHILSTFCVNLLDFSSTDANS